MVLGQERAVVKFTNENGYYYSAPVMLHLANLSMANGGEACHIWVNDFCLSLCDKVRTERLRTERKDI